MGRLRVMGRGVAAAVRLEVRRRRIGFTIVRPFDKSACLRRRKEPRGGTSSR